MSKKLPEDIHKIVLWMINNADAREYSPTAVDRFHWSKVLSIATVQQACKCGLCTSYLFKYDEVPDGLRNETGEIVLEAFSGEDVLFRLYIEQGLLACIESQATIEDGMFRFYNPDFMRKRRFK